MSDRWQNEGSSTPSYSSTYYNESSGFNRGRGDRQSSYSRGQNRYPNSGRDREYRQDYENTNYDTQKLVIHIDSDKVGKLIGRGGSKIRELQDESKTRINIDRSGGNSSTAVTITGSEDAQQEAKKLIEELLNDNHRTFQY